MNLHETWIQRRRVWFSVACETNLQPSRVEIGSTCVLFLAQIFWRFVFIFVHVFWLYLDSSLVFMFVVYVSGYIYVFVMIGPICASCWLTSYLIFICFLMKISFSSCSYLYMYVYTCFFLDKKQTAKSQWLSDQPWKMVTVSSYGRRLVFCLKCFSSWLYSFIQ